MTLQNDPMPPAPKFSQAADMELALPVPPSFSLDEANSFVEIEIQASQLLNYIDKITSFADRACSAAMRQSEETHRLEENRFVELRRTLEVQSDKIQQQQVAMARLEEQSKAQIDALEFRLRQSELQRAESQKPPAHGNSAPTQNRAAQAKPAGPQQQSRAKHTDPGTDELAALRILSASREETIRAKDEKITKIQIDSRAKILELEQRLSETVKELQNSEAMLKEKELVIRATARKEAEMGKLIQRLSAECNRLSTEMQQKNETSQPQENRGPLRIDATIWRMIGRMQEESQ